MAKGHYPDGGTVIGPRDVGWFGDGKVKQGVGADAHQVAARRANPLTPDIERRIANLRIDIKGLTGQIEAVERQQAALVDQRSRSAQELADLLARHGLPTDAGLPPAKTATPQPATGKTTSHQRRKNAKDKQTHAR